jgi:FdhD protein
MPPPAQNNSSSIQGFGVQRYITDRPSVRFLDQIAVEDPLEIALCFRRRRLLVRKPISITMRTPGMDQELAIGFLYTEGIIHTVETISNIEIGPASSITLTIDSEIDLQRLERHFYASSSCGVCGKSSLQALAMNREIRLDPARPRSEAQSLLHLPQIVRQKQSIFESTGALHAAAFFDSGSGFVRVCEDVGRHNAVDKLIGAELQSGRKDFSNLMIFVSGRAGFELVQKSLMSGIPFMAAVGAPSSLAVELARKYGSTLVGFLKKDRFNLYSGPERIGCLDSAGDELSGHFLNLEIRKSYGHPPA